MKKYNFYLPEQQADRLRKLSDKTGLSVAELVRRAVDAMLKREDKGNDQRTKARD